MEKNQFNGLQAEQEEFHFNKQKFSPVEECILCPAKP
jgi:hypothetical protein